MLNGDGTNYTEPNQKYFVIEKGEGSLIPVTSGSFFMSPNENIHQEPDDPPSQIQLVLGDRLFTIKEDRFCKTSASFEVMS